MKRLLLFLSLGVVLLAPVAGFGKTPHAIGGFSLGKSLDAYKDRVWFDTLFPLRHSKYIHEIEVDAPEGFKNGLLWVGNCSEPAKIMRIRLRYEDSSKKFYKELLKRFKKRFGDPTQWQGDPFHIVLAWKWAFTDQQGNRVSLVLQHNTRDEEESKGNTVKLTMWNLIEEERNCYRKTQEAKMKTPPPAGRSKPSWDLLIPK